MVTLTELSDLTLQIQHTEEDDNAGHITMFKVEGRRVKQASSVMRSMLECAFSEAFTDQPALEGNSVKATGMLDESPD